MPRTLLASRDGLKKAEKKKRKQGLKISEGGGFIVAENRLKKVHVRERREFALRFYMRAK
ncbi:MAG: hypothetical protein KME26_24110 [Oscillatoria princeps RMCB-10]|jgi:hypothetical protein|nr:hypothetical protein [Oscillatoria princeps RMCB-10]